MATAAWRRTPLALLLASLLAAAGARAQAPHVGPSWDLSHGRLQAPPGGARLRHADGTPFVWIGDTAWELFHRLDRDEAERYLEDRRRKGFTVIQAVALAELGGLDVPNAYGHLPLVGGDPARPDTVPGPRNDYWDQVDWIVGRAAEKGMYVGLLPTWAEWVTPRFARAPTFQTPRQAYEYGRFIGRRYRSRTNVIWILGGDRLPDERPEGIAIWRAMAEGVADGVNGDSGFDGRAEYGSTLMSYHAFPSSSRWFHQDEWIDAHMWGTYHFRRDDPRSYEAVLSDLALPGRKPTINGEPPYEDHPIDWKPEGGWFDDFDVRQAAYWSFLAGAAGYTYGAHPVWQFHERGRKPASPTRHTWTEVLGLPGAWQMLHLRRLLQSRPFADFRPDQALIVEGQARGGGHLRAGRGEDYLLVYAPTGRSFTLLHGRITGAAIRAWWFDPRTGQAREIGRFANAGTQAFDPPGEEGRGNDWLLVVDDASRGYAAPGAPVDLPSRRLSGG